MFSHRLSLWLVGACAAALVSATGAPEAAACSCVGTRVVPTGAEAVPRNVVVAVRTQAEWAASAAVREAGSQQPVAAEVAVIDLYGNEALALVDPGELLEAGGEYEVVLDTGDAPQVVSRLSVSDEVDDAAPAAPRIDGVTAEAFADDGSYSSASCQETPGGYFGRLRLAFDAAPEGVAHAVLRLRVGDAPAETVAISRPVDSASLVLETLTCDPLPAIRPGESYCATLTAYDLAGNASSSDEACTSAGKADEGCRAAGGASGAAGLALVGLVAALRRRSRLAGPGSARRRLR